jgi:hypothetical protein
LKPNDTDPSLNFGLKTSSEIGTGTQIIALTANCSGGALVVSLGLLQRLQKRQSDAAMFARERARVEKAASQRARLCSNECKL